MMSTWLQQLLFTFLIITLALCAMAIGLFLTGTSKMEKRGCGLAKKDPACKSKDGTKESCPICQKEKDPKRERSKS